MRRRRLADIDHEIRLATQRILSLDKELKIAQAAARGLQTETPASRCPFVYQQRITDAANAILAEDSLIRDRQAERERLNEPLRCRRDAPARIARAPDAQIAPGTGTRPVAALISAPIAA